ncbi:dimerization protein [Spatholobus suberectus]|nr:dimerization protein [Spatholobus suberectus]
MDENKKCMHKETERQRRQEMGKLCTTLRSLLPIEYIKGKRSTSDHVYEAMNFINHLQNKVNQLQAKRDELAKVSNLSNIRPENESSSTTHLPPLVFVHPFPGGLEIICSYSFRKSAFPISRVLDILLKEGLNVVSTTSIRRDGRFIHTIRSEDPNMTVTDYSELQIKLMEAISSSSLQETLPEPEIC